MRVTVFSTDLLPLAGVPTSGTALRTFGLVQGLKAHGHSVTVCVPKAALDGFFRAGLDRNLSVEVSGELEMFKQTAFDSFNQADLIYQTQPDMVLFGHWPAMTLRSKPSQALVIDLAGPHILERHYQKSPGQAGAIQGKLAALATADYYIVSGRAQRLYFLSYLMRCGVSEPERRMISIPMALSPELPIRSGSIGEGFPKFLFGGVFLPWQDPSWGLRKLAAELDRLEQGSLMLIGGKHPNYKIKQGAAKSVFSELEGSKRVTLKPMLPLEEFVRELSQAHVALDLMQWNLERQLALTIRTCTYLWSGLPVIYNDYADLGSLISQYDAGWTVAPGDDSAFSKVINEICAAPGIVASKGQNAQRLAREMFSWDRAVERLLNVIAQPGGEWQREQDLVVDYPDNTDYLVYEDRVLEQFFISRMNGLTKVECKLATHGRKKFKPVVFRLHRVLGDRPSKEVGRQALSVIKEVIVDNPEPWNNQWFSLEFDPITDSAGAVFMLEINSPHSELNESVSPWSLRWSPYPCRGLRYRGELVADQAICLRTTCSSFVQ